MSIAVKKNTSVGVEIEVTEGVYVAPSSATKFVQTLVDGFDISPKKNVLERNIFTASIGKTSPRVGQSQVSGTIPCEARANSVEGAAPEYNALMKSAMGTSHAIASSTTTKASGNTGTELCIDDSDISKFQVGDIVMVKEAGAYHVSPILTVDSTSGAAKITLLVAKPLGSFSNSVVISKSITYNVADTGHPSLSISKYIEGAVLEKAVGCKVTSMSLDKFSTGQLPSFHFGFEGLDYAQSVTSIPFTPSYDSALPPIVLDGRLYMDGTALDVNEISVSLQNALGFQTAFRASNGRVSSRATERTITGSLNPYKTDVSVDIFTKYQSNTAFSLFAYAKVPTATTGEFNQVVAVYMPNCIITEVAEADQDGLLQDKISFSANRGPTGVIPEIYIGFV